MPLVTMLVTNPIAKVVGTYHNKLTGVMYEDSYHEVTTNTYFFLSDHNQNWTVQTDSKFAFNTPTNRVPLVTQNPPPLPVVLPLRK